MKEKITHLGHYEENEIYRIAFLGGAAWEEDEQTFKDAFETAELLAQKGYEIVNGGGPGIMRASTLGAHKGGGKAFAVTYRPAYKHKNYEGVDEENDYDSEIVTVDYFDRTKVMLQNSSIHIVFNGGTGTISEFGMTWASSRIHEGHNKPIILFGKFWKDIIEVIKTHMLLRPGELELFEIAETPQHAVEIVEKIRKKNHKGWHSTNPY